MDNLLETLRDTMGYIYRLSNVLHRCNTWGNNTVLYSTTIQTYSRLINNINTNVNDNDSHYSNNDNANDNDSYYGDRGGCLVLYD